MSTGRAPATGRTDANSSLLAAIRARVQAHPDAAALRSAACELNYAALDHTSHGFTAALRNAGVRINDLVALTTARDIDTIVLLIAILQAGAACLPLDENYPAERLRAMLEDARPRLLVTEDDDAVTWPSGIARISRTELALREAQPDAAEGASIAVAALAYVLFTSGSSGRPKGVAMRSVALARLIDWHVRHPRLGLAARTLQFAPLSFDVSFQEILSTFATGGCLVLPSEAERRDPYALLALIERERIERLFLPYVALQALAEAVATGGALPATLHDVVTAGEQLRITPAIRALFVALQGCVLHNHYGPTETHVVTAYELAGDPATWPELPLIGHPLPHVHARVVDADLNAAIAGNEGELLLGGDCLAAGYIHRPELTAERFVELDGERWYRTGDRVREHDGSGLEYLGRIDAQIKIDGYRIEPVEIEMALCRHPAVAEAAVVAVDAARGRHLVAYVVPRDAQSSDAELVAQLRAHCAAQLAPYLVPQRIVVQTALPLTASGKIDRGTLARSHDDSPLRWPDAPLEQQLQALWQQLLDLPELDVQANLFDRGARSLTVVRALTELRRRGFRKLSAAQIYEYPSVAKQAVLLGTEPEAVPVTAAARARGEHQRAALSRFGPRKSGEA